MHVCGHVWLCHRCVLLCVLLSCENPAVHRVRTSSYLQAERLLWSVGTTLCNVFGQVSNPEVWPAQTIKGMPTVILALFFHYGSAAVGVLINHIGLPRKWMGTDSAESGAPGVLMSWLLRSQYWQGVALIFCLLIGISPCLLSFPVRNCLPFDFLWNFWAFYLVFPTIFFVLCYRNQAN